ncbi:MAG: tRNA uracil 4-sulfurtransferase ThiI [Coriobacteriia bacterium]|nr:tRNA uracil 4-sulfurtransferase ThiI [Coriobacteriia bacterium]
MRGDRQVRVALVHYHEIGLKGLNRGSFERRLETNIKWALRDIPSAEVGRIASRVLVRINDDSSAPDVAAALARTPGISYAAIGMEVEQTPEAIASAALELARAEIARRGGAIRTFGIEARRSATDYPECSMDMNRRVGDVVREGTGLAVDLSAPDLMVRIAVVQGAAYVHAERVDGPGGLPVGTSGKVMALLSAGIDSPVAAWRVMRRGATIVGVHFSGRPQTVGTSERAVEDLARVLVPGGGMGRLFVIPFGAVQRTISLDAPPDIRVLLYRRLMVRVAEALARVEGARALVTGESLGQVASQTLENIAVVDAVATLPVFRPLIGSDKQEIVAEARALGTYELSIATDDDCCTLFMPRRPQTHARHEEIAEGEAGLDIPALVAQALAGATHVDFPSVSYRAPRMGQR